MGIDQSYYGHILRENGRGNLRIEHLERLLNAASVSPLWVLTGQGDMILRESQDFLTENEPTEEEVTRLYELVINQEGSAFDTSTPYLAKFICAQVIFEFSDTKDLAKLALAVRAYMHAIKRLPGTNFMDIMGVKHPLGQSDLEQFKPDQR